MKPENKEALKEFFGEFAIQLFFALIVLLLGGIGLAYLLIGWGVLWLILPFSFIIYEIIKRKK